MELTATANSTCPLCGVDHPHEHTAMEIVCYRNGVKRTTGERLPLFDLSAEVRRLCLTHAMVSADLQAAFRRVGAP